MVGTIHTHLVLLQHITQLCPAAPCYTPSPSPSSDALRCCIHLLAIQQNHPHLVNHMYTIFRLWYFPAPHLCFPSPPPCPHEPTRHPFLPPSRPRKLSTQKLRKSSKPTYLVSHTAEEYRINGSRQGAGQGAI
jgi:hypothetical protein